MPSAIRNKARRAPSHAGRMLSAWSKIPARRWFWSLSTGGVPGAGAPDGATSTDPRTQRNRTLHLHSSAGFPAPNRIYPARWTVISLMVLE